MENILKCSAGQNCGGCQLLNFSYQQQLEKKQNYISQLLKPFGKCEKIIGMNDPYHYRNKVQVSFAYDDKHRVICGNYVKSTHIVVPIDDCLISDEISNRIIVSIRRLVNKYRISIFDENVYKGCLRHVLIRSTNLSQYMVVLVTGSYTINKQEAFIKDLLKYNPEITTIVQNINNKRTSMVLGEKNRILYGSGYVYDELCNYRFKISPSSFYQINKRQTEILYKTALELAAFNKDDIVIDAYCGTGTIGIIAAKDCKKVYGVELNKQAIIDAKNNAINNKVKNIEFVADDAGRYMRKLANNNFKIDGLIMDPPRSGADDKFLNAIKILKPKTIAYVSCGPESLRNNLSFLTKRLYEVKKIQPIDMFPFTDHIETIVLLQRENS